MIFDIKIHLFEHFIHINNNYPLISCDYPDVPDDNETASEFTYYDYLYKDINDYRYQLYENNISNVDAQFILSEYVKAILFSKTYSREEIKYTDNDLIGYQNETEYSEGFVDFALERIFERTIDPLILFKDLYLASYSFDKEYPLDNLKNKNFLSDVVSCHLSYLPFKAFSRYLNLDKIFTSLNEAVEWEKNLYEDLNACNRLSEFIELRQFVLTTLEKIKYLDEIYPNLCSFIYQIRFANDNIHLENEKILQKTAFLDTMHTQWAPELVVSKYVWDYIYNSDNAINPNLSHTSKVKIALKHLSSLDLHLPTDARFIDRVTSITAPRKVKNHKDWDVFFEKINDK